jgi:hypothetical protein
MEFENQSWNTLCSSYRINFKRNVFNGDNFSFFKMRNSSHSNEPKTVVSNISKAGVIWIAFSRQSKASGKNLYLTVVTISGKYIAMVTGIEKRFEDRRLNKQESRTTMISFKKICEYLNLMKK